MASETALPPGAAPEPTTSVGHGSELNGGGPQSGLGLFDVLKQVETFLNINILKHDKTPVM